MSNTLNRLLKLAAIIQDSGDSKALERFCVQCDAFFRKYGHYSPMQGPGDYDFSKETGKLPWSGSTTEFLKNFPGGIPEWKRARENLKAQSFEFEDGIMKTKNELPNKKAHYEPKNDGTTPNPWRKNMDYSEFDNSPYYGSVGEFMKKFPGGIRDWVNWRKNTQKDRWTRWDTKKNSLKTKSSERMARITELTGIVKNTHYEPVGPDDVKKYEQEDHLYSDEGLKNFKSVKEYIEKHRKDSGMSADDVALSAVKDFINYWKLLLKGKDKRKKAKKGKG